MILILLVILFSGLLGGGMNFYLTGETAVGRLTIWQSLFIGFGAALMVPLFLNISSSNLIDEIMAASEGTRPAKLLVLAGFCLVASISSRAFIQSVSDRLLREVQKGVQEAKDDAKSAKEEAKEAMVLTEQLVEDDERFPESNSNSRQAVGTEYSETEKVVLRAMNNSKFLLRAASGITKGTKLDQSEIESALDSLSTRGLVGRRNTRKGFAKWYLTNEGQQTASGLGS